MSLGLLEAVAATPLCEGYRSIASRSMVGTFPTDCLCSSLINLPGMTQIVVCTCAPARHLLVAGYFPTAPLLPTMAIDVRMLEFMHELYLRSPPNRSAWSSALEAFYIHQGVSLTGTDVIRRKLAKAAQYYALLRIEAQAKIRNTMLTAHRRLTSAPADNGLHDADGENPDDWEDQTGSEAHEEYLRRCCPLCFTNLKRDPSRL
jgi:hypothetical protein